MPGRFRFRSSSPTRARTKGLASGLWLRLQSCEFRNWSIPEDSGLPRLLPSRKTAMGATGSMNPWFAIAAALVVGSAPAMAQDATGAAAARSPEAVAASDTDEAASPAAAFAAAMEQLLPMNPAQIGAARRAIDRSRSASGKPPRRRAPEPPRPNI